MNEELKRINGRYLAIVGEEPSRKMVVCTSEDGYIAVNGKIPWGKTEEMMFFRFITMDNVVVMGRKTYEDIGGRLPHRTNVVLSRQWELEDIPETMDLPDIILTDLDVAVDMFRDADSEISFIGGASVYEEGLKHCNWVIRSIMNEFYIPEEEKPNGIKFKWHEPEKLEEVGFELVDTIFNPYVDFRIECWRRNGHNTYLQ